MTGKPRTRLAKPARSRRFNMRLSHVEFARMQALTEHYGLSAANLIRMIIKRECASLGIEPATDKTRDPQEPDLG